MLLCIFLEKGHCFTRFEKRSASLVAQMEKNPPATQETWVQSLRWEEPLEEGMATHSSFLAWIIPRTEEPGVMKSQTQLSD